MADAEDQLAQYPDPFTPGVIPGMPAFETLRNQVATMLDQPGARNALLQAGVSLLTPQWGSPIGHIGQAIGAGGEAASRAQEAELRREEAASKQDLRAAQAGAAEARANTAGVAAGLQRERLLATRENLGLQQRVKLALGYGPYEAKVNAENARALNEYNTKTKILDPTAPPPTPIPLLSPEEWINRQQTLLGPTGIVAPSTQSTPTPSAGAPQRAAPTPQKAPTGKTPVEVETPEEAAKLPPGTYYRVRKTGDEFIR